jgi:hypothetical protein
MNKSLARSRQGHGSRACYTNGCQEPECRAANAEYMRDYRAGLRGTTGHRLGGYQIRRPPHLAGITPPT